MQTELSRSWNSRATWIYVLAILCSACTTEVHHVYPSFRGSLCFTDTPRNDIGVYLHEVSLPDIASIELDSGGQLENPINLHLKSTLLKAFTGSFTGVARSTHVLDTLIGREEMIRRGLEIVLIPLYVTTHGRVDTGFFDEGSFDTYRSALSASVIRSNLIDQSFDTVLIEVSSSVERPTRYPERLVEHGVNELILEFACKLSVLATNKNQHIWEKVDSTRY
jgi:hypothetical protein